MMVGWSASFLVLTGACQFGHGLGGFASNFIHLFTQGNGGGGRGGSWGVVRAAVRPTDTHLHAELCSIYNTEHRSVSTNHPAVKPGQFNPPPASTIIFPPPQLFPSSST